MSSSQDKWLLIFYSVPSQPVSSRMKIWRKLAKVGAVQLKGAVYILPFSEEHYEFFQWLVSEVTSMGGEGAFVRVDSVETMEDAEIRELFNRQHEKEYRALERKLEDLERRVQSFRKGTRTQNIRQLSEQMNKMKKEFDEIRTLDFFSSKAGDTAGKRIKAMETEIKGMAAPVPSTETTPPVSKRIEDYQGKTWVTRKNPFVDRMASAWLIKRFIDREAVFDFIDERELGSLGRESTAFDIRGGEFTHQGDLCTFEVLVKTFGIKDKAVKKIAEIVHDLDLKDGKYGNPEAPGLEEILIGIRKTAKGDSEALEKGMAVFEMLYSSKT